MMPDTSPEKSRKESIYIIAGQKRNAINDRVEKIFSLKNHFGKMQLVSQSNGNRGKNEIPVKPASNPTGILRILGLNKIKKYIDKFAFFPSNNILYAKAVEKTLKPNIISDINQGLSVIILICVPPHDLSLLGIKLKRLFPQIKLIMDWQDLWSYDENYYLRVPKFYRNRLLATEQKALNLADLNITTNTHAKSILIDKFNIPSDKIQSISHHYNREDLLQPHEQKVPKDNAPITIGFLGTLFKPPRVPGQKIVDAIQKLRKNGLDIELHVHGMVSEATKNQLTTSDMEGIVLHGQSSHQESLKLVADYDFMLLLLADLSNSKIVMSIKLPHYFLTGKPILAIVPADSALANIITKTKSGYIIDSSKEISGPLAKILTDHMHGDFDYKPDTQAIESYSWENISQDWIQVLSQRSNDVKTTTSIDI